MDKIIEYVLEIINNRMLKNKCFILAVGGVGCSGKTTLAKKIAEEFGKEASILPVDCYYKDYKVRRSLGITGAHPKSINLDLLKEHLERLSNCKNVILPKKESTGLSDKGGYEFCPKKIVIIEGLFSLTSSLLKFYDLSIFIDCPDNLQLDRRLIRDKKKVLRNKEDIIETFYKRKIEFDKYLRPFKEKADIVLLSEKDGFKLV